MAQERLTMRKVREILRLYHDRKLSQRAVARSCRVSHSTVKEYVERAQAAGLSWPLPDGLSEAALYALLYPEKARAEPGDKALPDWKYIKQELGKKHVTLKLLWVEYREQYSDGYGYSQFCELYKEWKGKLDPPMRQTHKAGEKAFVDYTGDTVAITNPETGEISQAEIFVATLGYSNYTYAEAQASQSKENWIGGHVRTFTFWGGVTAVLVPDNLKAGVKDPCYYDPELNPNYQELAEHYSTVVLPSRVRKPRDKAKVEVGVQVVERWILARLRNRTFFSLAELNQAIWALLDELNSRPMAHLEQSRRELFETVEKPALQPLPDKPYEFVQHKVVRVNIDYHVDFDKHYYSVPHELIHEEVRIRASERLVEIYHKSQVDPVAIHPRSHAPGRYSTRKEHMPPKHQKHLEWSPERFVHWANRIGPQTTAYVQAVLVSRRHPEQAYRTCLGLLNLAKSHPVEGFETACQQALEAKLFSYRELKDLLVHLPASAAPSTPPPNHPNLRGNDYYQ
jgi:transposase